MKKIHAVAIDGPAGAGKSTVAKIVSRELGYIYVDTGAMYRAIALFFLKKGISAEDRTAMEAALPEIDVSIRYEDGAQKVLLNGEDVSGLIRTEEVGNMASAASAFPPVRAKLLSLQRGLAEREPVVMDGRDIGTVVLPDADTKIYLTASVEVRAKRRYKELTEKGISCSLSEIAKDIEARDWRDMHRETAPLKKADDAVLVDSSDMTLEEVCSTILAVVRGERYAR